MKKNIFLLFLLIGITTSAQDYSIFGKIVNENQESLAGATILVKELRSGTSSDINGEFILKAKEGTYTLVISYVGYKTIEREVVLPQSQDLVIILVSDDTVLAEVLVKAIRATSKIPVTYSNLSKQEISKRNLGQDIPILLQYLPSTISSSDAGAGVGYTYLNVRGSNNERINVTINGIPTTMLRATVLFG